MSPAAGRTGVKAMDTTGGRASGLRVTVRVGVAVGVGVCVGVAVGVWVGVAVGGGGVGTAVTPSVHFVSTTSSETQNSGPPALSRTMRHQLPVGLRPSITAVCPCGSVVAMGYATPGPRRTFTPNSAVTVIVGVQAAPPGSVGVPVGVSVLVSSGASKLLDGSITKARAVGGSSTLPALSVADARTRKRPFVPPKLSTNSAGKSGSAPFASNTNGPVYGCHVAPASRLYSIKATPPGSSLLTDTVTRSYQAPSMPCGPST